MEDTLYEAALQYSSILDKGYTIVLGRTGKTYIIELRFNKSDFFHLAGLQHLKDITFYEQYLIDERIQYLTRLEEMLDSNKCIFLINKKEYAKYTNILADYLFDYILPENHNDRLYFFSIKTNNPRLENECIGCSFFKKHNVDYTKGAAETKLLLNVKRFNVGKNNEQKIELFRRENYIQNIPNFLD